jgi:MFS family permease
LVLVLTAAFMLLLDITVVSVALPSIQRDLDASLPDLPWVSAAYALVLACGGASAIGPLVGGVLTDTWGRRSIFFVNLPIGVGAFASGWPGWACRRVPGRVRCD